jgi:hypothetical protein
MAPIGLTRGSHYMKVIRRLQSSLHNFVVVIVNPLQVRQTFYSEHLHLISLKASKVRALLQDKKQPTLKLLEHNRCPSIAPQDRRKSINLRLQILLVASDDHSWRVGNGFTQIRKHAKKPSDFRYGLGTCTDAYISDIL